MLLETLDIKKNDVIIFSQNIFNPVDNFKIIFKDDPEKKIRKISFEDVCKFVNEYTPKNLIAYRLLTNLRNFEVDLTKHGFFISINGLMELMYFDPIFAVKEVEEYAGKREETLRFRIQQVGLTTITRTDQIANYTEIYNIDLLADEAKNQNDRVFAEAIFAKDPGFLNRKVPALPVNNSTEIKVKSGIQYIRHTISEDKDFSYKEVMKFNRTEPQPSSFSKFLIEKGRTRDESVAGIFRSEEKIKQVVQERENKRIVLKLDS